MIEGLDNIQYSPVIRYRYEHWFEEVKYNGKTLSEEERKDYAKNADMAVASFSEGLPMIYETLTRDRDIDDDFHRIERTVYSVYLFVLITMIDCIVASKYFIIADKDYDRRFMRGKLMVILNEGFKQLYGFDYKTHKCSEWNKLRPLLKYFPNEINLQYQNVTMLLKNHSRSSSWWKNDRDYETHIDAEKLYVSRKEEITESKVVMDSLKLFNALQAVEVFLGNVHSCILNCLVEKYKRGELKD